MTFAHYKELYISRILLDDLSFINVGVEWKDFACLCMPLFMLIVTFTEQKVKLCDFLFNFYLCKPHFENRHTTVKIKF